MTNQFDITVPGYNLAKEVGHGAMCRAFLAEREEDKETVVLKVFFLGVSEDTSEFRRFMMEYDMISGISHPNIVKIHERAFASDFAYIAMEYLPAGTLKKRIKPNMDVKVVLQYVYQIARGLSVIHANNIIHRDLKPGNIIFRDKNNLVITDFGISKDLSVTSGTSLTGLHGMVGTPYYMSPEQILGVQEIDTRSDIYSLGVILFQMLTNKKPFLGKSIRDIIKGHLYDPVPKLPSDLSKYQVLIDKMLAKKSDERFQNTQEIVKMIKKVISR